MDFLKFFSRFLVLLTLHENPLGSKVFSGDISFYLTNVFFYKKWYPRGKIDKNAAKKMKNPRLSQITKELRKLRIQYKNAPQSLKNKIKEKGLSLKKEYNAILIKRLGQKKNNTQLSIIEGWEK